MYTQLPRATIALVVLQSVEEPTHYKTPLGNFIIPEGADVQAVIAARADSLGSDFIQAHDASASS